VYRVVLGVYIEEHFSLVYHIVNSITQGWKFLFKSKIYCVRFLSTSFMTTIVIKYQYFHTGVRLSHRQLEESVGS